MTSRKSFYPFLVLFITFFSVAVFSCKQAFEGNATVAQAPVITAISSDVTTIFNKTVTLSITAEVIDGGILTYQWYSATQDKLKVGTPIEDGDGFSGTKSKDFMPAVSTAGIFYYYCVVTNTLQESTNSATSPRITVVVDSVINAGKPVITAEPVNIKAIIPAEGTFTIGAASPDNGTLTYQWYKLSENTSEQSEGTVITDAVQNTYKVTADAIGKTGYYCVITNTIEDNGDGGKKSESITSSVAYFEAIKLKDTLNSPIFTMQPVAMNVANPSVVLTCEAVVPNDYSAFYRWYKTEDGTIESNEPVSLGWSSSPDFETPSFTEKGIYYYFCRAASYIPSEDDNLEEVTSCSNVVSVAYTGLPTLYLNSGGIATEAITRDEYVLGSFKLISDQYGTLEYTFTKVDKKDGKVKEGIKGRGNSSWDFPKKGYNIKFDKKLSFFGLPESKKWCVIANYSDKSLLRNKFASILGTEVFNSEWNPNFENVDVVLNGEYIGNYIFCEKNTIGGGRIDIQNIVDVDENLVEGKQSKVIDSNNDGVKNLEDGGFLLEIDARYDADFWFDTTLGVPITLKDPDVVSDSVKERVRSVVQLAEDVLYGDEFTDPDEGWRKYIDENSVIDWYLINEFAKNVDAPFWLSVYMFYSPSDGKLYFGPNWDFDLGFGNVNYTNDENTTSCEYPEGWYVRIAKVGTVTNWISRMFEDISFVSNVKNRWNEKKLALYSACNTELKSFMDENSVSAEYNFLKWPILGTYIWPNATGYESRKTYQSEVQYLVDWCNIRYQWFDNAINK